MTLIDHASGVLRAAPRPWVLRLLGFLCGVAIVLARLALQPLLGAASPFMLSWPAIMLAAFIGGFWPAIGVTVLGLGVGQYVLNLAGAMPLGPGGQLIYLAFGVVFASAGGMRQRGLRRQRATSERLSVMQDQLMNTARLNAVGEFAGTLAHELNQPLTAISSYMGALQRLLARPEPPGPEVVELAEKAAEQAMRAREIVRRIRSHVRGEMTFETASLSQLVEEAVAFIGARQERDGMVVKLDLDPRADQVSADRIQVQQVLLNLLRNAAEAMAAQRRRQVSIISRGLSAEVVEICVADNGPGISPEVADRLFQPFASIKEGGTGLGLSISRTIVEAHGGKLWADPGGVGATFRFTLKLAAAGEASR